MRPTFTLASPETGTDYQIYVETPGRGVADQPMAAVLFMDGDDQFRFAVDAYLTVLEEQLARHPFAQLELISRRYPGLDHYNVLPVAFADGLKTLFS